MGSSRPGVTEVSGDVPRQSSSRYRPKQLNRRHRIVLPLSMLHLPYTYKERTNSNSWRQSHKFGSRMHELGLHRHRWPRSPWRPQYGSRIIHRGCPACPEPSRGRPGVNVTYCTSSNPWTNRIFATKWLLLSMHRGGFLSLVCIQRKALELDDCHFVHGSWVVSLDHGDNVVAKHRVLPTQVCSLGRDGLRKRVWSARPASWRRVAYLVIVLHCAEHDIHKTIHERLVQGFCISRTHGQRDIDGQD